jgi:hypothetical protein
MDTKQQFAAAKYLIYYKFDTKLSSGGTVGGSNYYNLYPKNEEEAIEMVEQVKKEAAEFKTQYPYLLNKDTIYKYGYHLNYPEWWTR